MFRYLADFLKRLRADKVLETKQPAAPHPANIAAPSPKRSKMLSSGIVQPPLPSSLQKKDTSQDLASVEFGTKKIGNLAIIDICP